MLRADVAVQVGNDDDVDVFDGAFAFAGDVLVLGGDSDDLGRKAPLVEYARANHGVQTTQYHVELRRVFQQIGIELGVVLFGHHADIVHEPGEQELIGAELGEVLTQDLAQGRNLGAVMPHGLKIFLDDEVRAARLVELLHHQTRDDIADQIGAEARDRHAQIVDGCAAAIHRAVDHLQQTRGQNHGGVDDLLDLRGRDIGVLHEPPYLHRHLRQRGQGHAVGVEVVQKAREKLFFRGRGGGGPGGCPSGFSAKVSISPRWAYASPQKMTTVSDESGNLSPYRCRAMKTIKRGRWPPDVGRVCRYT